MRVIHTSPAKITKITDTGMFGDCLFFAAEAYAMGTVKCEYALELADDKIIDESELFDDEIIANIARVIDCDLDDAERLLDGRMSTYELIDDGFDAGEQGWWIQGLQGTCARNMGFDACRAQDEQGAVYIVSMTDRLDRLTEI